MSEVLLFPDTFMNYHEPETGVATLVLLLRINQLVINGLPNAAKRATPAGNVWPDQLRCCGRPMISNGMLTEAVALAAHNVERLFPWASKGLPIIACEPSCILTIKDDYPALLQGDLRRKARTVAERCFTFDEFAETHWIDGLAPTAGPRQILVQGHCHQRSLVGMNPTLKLLRRIPGTEVIDLDAGCCGMAGSFGYEKEHYEISRMVGEQRLFPAIRQAASDNVIVAPGFSCRMQIEHFTGRKALHPAILLQSLLARSM